MAEAEKLAQAQALVEGGATKTAALGQVFPGVDPAGLFPRLRRYADGGVEALIDRRPMLNARKLTPEVKLLVSGMMAANPRLRAPGVQALLAEQGCELSLASVRRCMAELGVSQPRGRPSGPAKARRLPLAGAELLLALELELGAVSALTQAVDFHLSGLPAPSGKVLDDSDHRDEYGRFLPSYNEAKSRTWEEQGGKFDGVERRRGEKDLREMRVASESTDTRYRKDLSLTMLPILVGGPRWSELQHWYGELLGDLSGYPYQPATLDKYTRELKLAGASVAMKAATADFWLGSEGVVADELTGAVLVYIDATTKSIWTHSFARCAKVSSNGRTMPATSTVTLHSGAGTPLLYRSFSGHVSVSKEAPKLLKDYEAAGGEGTARRVVVLDREAHAAWLLKALDAAGWTYIIPLRSNVLGQKARFEDKLPAEPYTHNGANDEVIDSFLWLNDSRRGEGPIRTRAVARRRERTGKLAWFATNAPREEFGPSDVVRLYFDRWPLQEHVYREGKGAVGLDAHHGYGKTKVVDVAIVDKLEELDGKLKRWEVELSASRDEAVELGANLAEQAEAIARVEVHRDELQQVTDNELEAGRAGEQLFADSYRSLRAWDRWLSEAAATREGWEARLTKADKKVATLEGRLARNRKERERLEQRREIFTVDVELDEIMTAYKLTFLNLAEKLMRDYLGEPMEIDRLISAVLRLPGEVVRTPKVEVVRIYRQERDPRTMAAVERACAKLTDKKLRRGERRLRFELIDPPVS